MRRKAFSVMSGYQLKPSICLAKPFRKPDTQYTSGFLKPAGILKPKSVRWNIDTGTAFGEIRLISKRFHRISLYIFYEISEMLRIKMYKP
jgi:hypothetical protein